MADAGAPAADGGVLGKRPAEGSAAVKLEPGAAAAAGPGAGGAASGAVLKSEPGAAAGAATAAGQPVTKERVTDLKNKVASALAKRQKLLEMELTYLENGSGLLGFCHQITKSGIQQAGAGGDASKKGDQLTEEVKAFLS